MPVKLGDSITKTVLSIADKIGLKFTEGVQPYVTENVRQHMAHSILEPERFQTEELREIIKQIKKEMASSPDDMIDVVDIIVDLLTGYVAKLQFQLSTGVIVDEDTPYLNALFANMAIVTDLNLLISIVSILAEIFSFGQFDQIGREIRSYLDYSGLAQMTQFGYGMILSAALNPLIQKEVMAQTQPNVFDEATNIRLVFRKLVTEQDVLDDMNKLGYTNIRTQTMINGSWYYPSPTDFIRFAVREVFREDIVAQYGYDEAFPIDEPIPPDKLPTWIQDNVTPLPKTLRDLVNIGTLDEATLRWYWRSHWELPSPLMGYEMLHRKIIDIEDLETLLKIQDFAPFWIPHMVAISYSPYTRVDSRRMFELGVLSGEEYVTALEEIGYPRDKAEKMLEWTILRKMSPERDLTRTMIMNAFESGLKDRTWTIKQLKALGYDDDEADLIVSLKEFDITESELKDKIDVATLRFVNGLTTEEELTTALDELGLSEIRKLRITTSAQTKKDKLISLPTKADLLKWFTNDLITEDIVTERLLKLGFLNDDIALYIAEIKLGMEV